MPTTITFFPVDNGDMALIKFGDVDATTLLIDINIRQDAEDPDGVSRDVAKDLRDRLKRDENGRPYVDAFLLSHPDHDHCRGLTRHFYLGPLDKYPDDKKDDKDKKIVIREVWSSPIVFRRASKTHNLSDDAKAFNTEARRRVQVNRDKNFAVGSGDRIQIMGEDIDGKTDDLTPIVRRVDTSFSSINGKSSAYFSAFVLAPLDAQDDEEEEQNLIKNQSSVILNITLAADANTPDGAKFLTGGDAEVFIWNRQWQRHKAEADVLEYDIMQAPHHCSWHSLSEDSWFTHRERPGSTPTLVRRFRRLVTVPSSLLVVSLLQTMTVILPASVQSVSTSQSWVKQKASFTARANTRAKNLLSLSCLPSLLRGAASSKKEAGSKAAAVITSARTPMPHGAS